MSTTENKLALENFTGEVFRLNEELIRYGCKAAEQSRRKRIMFPVQRSQDDEVQRLINFLQPGSYIRPHKHPGKHASETVIVHQGAIYFHVFDEAGKMVDHFLVKAGTTQCMVDIVPGVWHNFIILEKDTVVIEFKKGPYDAQMDKTFAAWAPEVDTEAAATLLKSWMSTFNKQPPSTSMPSP